MCSQPHDPGQSTNNHANALAPAEQEPQTRIESRPNSRTRPRGGTAGTGRHLVVRGVRHDPPDIRKLARVVTRLAADISQAEAEPDTSRRDAA